MLSIHLSMMDHLQFLLGTMGKFVLYRTKYLRSFHKKYACIEAKQEYRTRHDKLDNYYQRFQFDLYLATIPTSKQNNQFRKSFLTNYLQHFVSTSE